MAASKHFLFDYLLKTLILGEKHHIHGTSLKNVIDKFTTLSSTNCRNFVAGARKSVHNGMDRIDTIMPLKDNLKFKYFQDN
jgi:hypothetical protein